MVAARNHPQAARIAAHGVQVERELDVAVRAARVAVGVPARVPHVEVAVAAGVVVVLARHVAGHVVDSRIVQQRAQVLALIDKGRQRRTLLIVVRPSVMPAPVLGPQALELLANRLGFIGKQSRKAQIPKRLEKGPLLRRELHPSTPAENAAASRKSRKTSEYPLYVPRPSEVFRASLRKSALRQSRLARLSPRSSPSASSSEISAFHP